MLALMGCEEGGVSVQAFRWPMAQAGISNLDMITILGT